MALAVFKCVITVCAAYEQTFVFCCCRTCILVISAEVNGCCYSFLQFCLKGFYSATVNMIAVRKIYLS